MKQMTIWKPYSTPMMQKTAQDILYQAYSRNTTCLMSWQPQPFLKPQILDLEKSYPVMEVMWPRRLKYEVSSHVCLSFTSTESDLSKEIAYTDDNLLLAEPTKRKAGAPGSKNKKTDTSTISNTLETVVCSFQAHFIQQI